MELTKRDKKFFEIAKRLSKKSEHHRHHIGCVITNGSKLVGLGFNRLKTHTRSTHPFHSIHAELHAILGITVSDLRGSKVYVYRENFWGQLAMSKPCPTCHKMLQDLGVREVFYTCENGYNSYSFY